MKKVNFDSLKNLKASDEWIQTALEIPLKTERKRTLRARIVAAAACAVLVIAASLNVFFLTKTNGRLPSDLPAHGAESTTGSGVENTYNSNLELYPTQSTGGGTQTQDETQSGAGSSAEPGSQPAPPIKATESTESTQASRAAATTASSSPNAAKAEQTTGGTPAPTEPEPTEPEPTRAEVVCYGIVDRSGWLIADEREMFFCRLYDAANKQVGDADIFSDQHRAEFYSDQNDVLHLSYKPLEKGVSLSSGEYTVYFYDDKGIIVTVNSLNVI